ncbi:MAG TPA: HAD hydrolase family protein [Burkholderiales bacterium]|nr:HAD hydrolase family protein [Burkholderiales bacterium]
MLVEPLDLSTPMACFNGAVLVSARLTSTREYLLPPAIAVRAIGFLDSHRADVWRFTVESWLLRDAGRPYVDLEKRTVRFQPAIVEDFAGNLGRAAKIVGVSGDFAFLKRLETDARAAFAGQASVARSQPYYLDFTHPRANKGVALLALSELLVIPPAEIAVIGDGPNDVAMFEKSGLSIAMGNASREVKLAADILPAATPRTDSRRRSSASSSRLVCDAPAPGAPGQV